MITAEAASVAISITKGLIRVSRETDLVFAEKAAVLSSIAVSVPPTTLSLEIDLMSENLEDLLQNRENTSILSARERLEIRRAIDTSDKPALSSLVAKFLPALAISDQFDLGSSFVERLKSIRPEWANDPNSRIAAFYVSSGTDYRSKNYSWRLAATIIDILFDLGAENTALFSRNPNVQSIVKSVLMRFGEADLQKLDDTSTILRAALSATLNGTLDGRASIQADNPWLDGLLDSLVAARESLPTDERDEFIVGILHGRGYPLLVASVLEEGANRLNGDEVVDFRDLAADFLKNISSIVKTKPSFEGFFEDHWGDLLRAALSSVATVSPTLLADKVLLGKIVSQVASSLAENNDSKLLSGEALFGIVESVASVVAANPLLAGDFLGTDKKWIQEVIESISGTLADDGLRKTFSRAGIEDLFKSTLTVFAKHPELLAGDNKLAGSLVGGVLEELALSKSIASRDLASAAVGGALTALARNPRLLKMHYPELVASFAGRVAQLVKDQKITGVQGTALMEAALASFSEHPELFAVLGRKLGEEVVATVTKVAGNHPGSIVAGITFSEIVRETLSSLAKTGQKVVESTALTDLIAQLEQVLNAALQKASQELGRTLSLPSVPTLIGLLVELWLKGEPIPIGPDDPLFAKILVELETRAAA